MGLREIGLDPAIAQSLRERCRTAMDATERFHDDLEPATVVREQIMGSQGHRSIQHWYGCPLWHFGIFYLELATKYRHCYRCIFICTYTALGL